MALSDALAVMPAGRKAEQVFEVDAPVAVARAAQEGQLAAAGGAESNHRPQVVGQLPSYLHDALRNVCDLLDIADGVHRH